MIQITWDYVGNLGLHARPKNDGKEWVQASRRGAMTMLRRRFVIQDPFGLARLAFERDSDAAIEIRPHLGRLRALSTLTSLAGGEDRPHPSGSLEGDRVELRRYAPGDPARFIHWKIFSRTRRLMVRMPERSLMETRRTLAYLVAGPSDEATAAVACVAVDTLLATRGQEWLFGADGAAPTNIRDEAVGAIVRSQGRSGAVDLASFVDSEEARGPASLMLFVPPIAGPWLERALAVARPRAERCIVLIGVDGLTPPKRSRWKQAFVRSKPTAGPHAHALRAVIDAFAAVGIRAHVFDRSTGRSLGSRDIFVASQAASLASPKVESRQSTMRRAS